MSHSGLLRNHSRSANSTCKMTSEQRAEFMADFFNELVDDIMDGPNSDEESENESSPDTGAKVDSSEDQSKSGCVACEVEKMLIAKHLLQCLESGGKSASEQDSENASTSDRDDEESNQLEAGRNGEPDLDNYLECLENLFQTYKDPQFFENSMRGEFRQYLCDKMVKAYQPRKPYSGNPVEWTKFWLNFENYFLWAAKMTSKKPLVFLKRNTIGEARAAIVGFKEDEYEQAVAVLKEKYGKPEIIEEACMKYVTDMPKLESDAIEELNEFCENINSNLLYFAENKDRRTVYSEQLAKGLLSKLPKALQRKISKRYRKSTLTLEKLMYELLRELKIGAMLDIDSLLGF